MSAHTFLPANPIDLPLLPLRDVVVFPHMVIPLFVGRPKSIKALETAMEAERRIMLVAEVLALTQAVAACLGRPPGQVHIQYAPPGSGRQAFGGTLVT